MMTRFVLKTAVLAAALLAFGCGGESDPAGPSGSKPGKPEDPIVIPYEPTALIVRADGDFKVGNTVQLRVFGDQDGDIRELERTSDFVFLSDDEEIATVDESGLVSVHKGGPVTFQVASLERGLEAKLPSRTSCDYPRFAADINFDRVMPNFSWLASQRDGAGFQLRMEDVYCDREWEDTQTILFVLSAGWCQPCTQWARELETMVDSLEADGMKIVIAELETKSHGVPADSDFAYRHLAEITKSVPSIAIGDLDTTPEPGFLIRSGIFQGFFPTSFVIRTRDMKIIADGNRTQYRLPVESIAKNPEWDWSDPTKPIKN